MLTGVALGDGPELVLGARREVLDGADVLAGEVGGAARPPLLLARDALLHHELGRLVLLLRPALDRDVVVTVLCELLSIFLSFSILLVQA